MNIQKFWLLNLFALCGMLSAPVKAQINNMKEFEPVGIGKDATLRLNGRRIMLRTVISWGYWPVTGLYATPVLNFHRSIGSPVVLEKADELGLLYYEEPGTGII